MKLNQAFALLAYGAVRSLLSNSKLTWSTVHDWIMTNSNRDNYGRGFALGHLPQSGGNSYAEIRKEISGGRIRITAAIFFDAHQGPAATQTWEVKTIDSELEKVFGRNLRVRVNV